MHEFIEWCGFLGGWLLVAGPIYQAALELREEEFERDVFARAQSALPPSLPISAWWWVVPPVYYLLDRRARRRQRDAAFRALSTEHRLQLVGFVTKAHAWMTVALGAFFIAVKETYELCEAYEWPVAIFWILVIVMPILAFLNTAARIARERRMREITATV